MVCGACASVPREAAELSRVASRRVADTQSAHEALVLAYFQLSRDRIEDFLEHRWTPAFLGRFVAEARLMDELQNPVALSDAQRTRLTDELTRAASLRGEPLERAVLAVNSAFGDTERGQIVLEFAEAAMGQIERQRRELLAPISAQERQVLGELRANYAETMEIQAAITAYLGSVQRVKEEEDAVLRRLNLLRARDSVVARAIALNEDVVRLTGQAQNAEKALTDMRAKLGLPTPPPGAPADSATPGVAKQPPAKSP